MADVVPQRSTPELASTKPSNNMLPADIPPLATAIPKLLRSILQVAYDYRWVSDFLFTELTASPFHPDLPLPPRAFSTTLTVDEHQHMSLYPDPLYPHHATASPLPKALIGEPPPDATDDCILHTVFIPVCSLATITVGYAFLAHDVPLENCMPANPLIPPLIARFVLDTRTDTLIFINRGGTPPSIGIRAMRNSCLPNCRDHFSFMVADTPYRWPHLPTSSIWMLSHIESMSTLSQKPSPEAYAANPLSVPVPPKPAGTDAAPWPVNAGGILSDGLTPCWETAPSQDTENGMVSMGSVSAAGAFNSVARTRAVVALARIHCGTFCAAAMRMDALDMVTGTFQSCLTGNVRFVLGISKTDVAEQLRVRLVTSYFAEALGPSCDTPLLVMNGEKGLKKGRREERLQGDGTFARLVEGLSESTSVNVTQWEEAAATEEIVQLDGVMVSSLLDSAVETSGTGASNGDDEELAGTEKKKSKEEVLQNRKRRNRLSAARSNERRRERIEKLERDVEEGRRIVASLTQRREAARQENERLRGELTRAAAQYR